MNNTKLICEMWVIYLELMEQACQITQMMIIENHLYFDRHFNA